MQEDRTRQPWYLWTILIGGVSVLTIIWPGWSSTEGLGELWGANEPAYMALWVYAVACAVLFVGTAAYSMRSEVARGMGWVVSAFALPWLAWGLFVWQEFAASRGCCHLPPPGIGAYMSLLGGLLAVIGRIGLARHRNPTSERILEHV